MNDNRKPEFEIGNLIPCLDEHGRFFDFYQKTGHPLITDYSQIDREIVIGPHSIWFESEIKKKKEIKSVNELTEALHLIIVDLFDSNLEIQKSFLVNHAPSDSIEDAQIISLLDNLDKNSESERRRYEPFIIRQVIFDILYDKYRKDSPLVTLNEYCVKFINYDWDNQIWETISSGEHEISRELYNELYDIALAEFTKFDDVSQLTINNLLDKIKDNENLHSDYKKLNEFAGACPGDCQETIKEYLRELKDELVRKKNAAYKSMIEEIKREHKVMSNPVLMYDAAALGVDPDLFLEHIITLNDHGKREVKRPKFVWDYLYYNGCPGLITSKQFKRTFKKDDNISYERFISDFDKYDLFVETIIPTDEDKRYDYCRKAMDYYHLEIYKRLDFIYNLAERTVDEDWRSIDKEHFLVKRFHPIVFWPSVDKDNNCLYYGEKYKYYRPLVLIEDLFPSENPNVDRDNKESATILYAIRAKAYEVFRYKYEFIPDDYEDIENFIRSKYDMLSFHKGKKVWYYMEGDKKKYRKTLIQNVLTINNALFGERKTAGSVASEELKT